MWQKIHSYPFDPLPLYALYLWLCSMMMYECMMRGSIFYTFSEKSKSRCKLFLWLNFFLYWKCLRKSYPHFHLNRIGPSFPISSHHADGWRKYFRFLFLSKVKESLIMKLNDVAKKHVSLSIWFWGINVDIKEIWISPYSWHKMARDKGY